MVEVMGAIESGKFLISRIRSSLWWALIVLMIVLYFVGMSLYVLYLKVMRAFNVPCEYDGCQGWMVPSGASRLTPDAKGVITGQRCWCCGYSEEVFTSFAEMDLNANTSRLGSTTWP